MRPHGPIRQAALRAAWDVASARGDQPWVTRHDLEQRLVPAGVGRRAVKYTWENLLRSGALQRQGRVWVPAVGRQVQACLPVAPAHGVGADARAAARAAGAPQRGAQVPDLAALWWRGSAGGGM